jgi:Flp pilus assembly protein protease CpaA
MKIPDVIIISLTVAFFIIAIHQTMTAGFGNAYWAIMLALLFFFVFNLRRRKS